MRFVTSISGRENGQAMSSGTYLSGDGGLSRAFPSSSCEVGVSLLGICESISCVGRVVDGLVRLLEAVLGAEVVSVGLRPSVKNIPGMDIA